MLITVTVAHGPLMSVQIVLTWEKLVAGRAGWVFVSLVIGHSMWVLAAMAADVAYVLSYSINSGLRTVPSESGALDCFVLPCTGMAGRGGECRAISTESMAAWCRTSVAMAFVECVLMEVLMGVVDATAEAECQ